MRVMGLIGLHGGYLKNISGSIDSDPIYAKELLTEVLADGYSEGDKKTDRKTYYHSRRGENSTYFIRKSLCYRSQAFVLSTFSIRLNQ